MTKSIVLVLIIIGAASTALALYFLWVNGRRSIAAGPGGPIIKALWTGLLAVAIAVIAISLIYLWVWGYNLLLTFCLP